MKNVIGFLAMVVGMVTVTGVVLIALQAGLDSIKPPPSPCTAILASGVTVEANADTCYSGYNNGTLHCNGVTYGPGAWVSLMCEGER